MNGCLKYCRKGLWAVKADSPLPPRLSQNYEVGILSIRGNSQLSIQHVSLTNAKSQTVIHFHSAHCRAPFPAGSQCAFNEYNL